MPPMLDRRRVQKILSKWSAVSRRSAVDKRERKMPPMLDRRRVQEILSKWPAVSRRSAVDIKANRRSVPIEAYPLELS